MGNLPDPRALGRELSVVATAYGPMRDLLPAQRFARHVPPLTATVSTHPSDQEEVVHPLHRSATWRGSVFGPIVCEHCLLRDCFAQPLPPDAAIAA